MRPRLPAPILLYLLLAVSAWMFIELADEVVEGESRAADRAVMGALRAPEGGPLGPPWLHEMARDVTALGSAWVVGLTIAMVGGFLLLRDRRAQGLLLAGSGAGSFLLTHLLKLAFSLPRPDMGTPLAQVFTAGFPSAHASVTASVVIVLGQMIAEAAPGWGPRLYITLWSLVVVFAVGLSRVYLGVHWPSDVLAGWVVGTAWAILCLILYRSAVKGEPARAR